MPSRLLDLEMTGFILCQAFLSESLDTEDETLRELTERDIGFVEVLINVNDISHVFSGEYEDCIIQLRSGNIIKVKNDIDHIIQQIRRATAINIFAQ
jgi:uncharacterized protein YlzI (FlbEa/FlbD family)